MLGELKPKGPKGAGDCQPGRDPDQHQLQPGDHGSQEYLVQKKWLTSETGTF